METVGHTKLSDTEDGEVLQKIAWSSDNPGVLGAKRIQTCQLKPLQIPVNTEDRV